MARENDLRVDCISRAEVIDIVENTATEWLKGDINFMYPSLIKKIKGLPSVTPQPCEDAVSRQVAIDAIRRIHPIDTDYDCTLFDKVDVMYVLSDLPSVTPQPRKGHWIKVTNGRGGHECDLCHEYAPSYQSGDEHLTNYCPNCGAKMIEPQESEDKE